MATTTTKEWMAQLRTRIAAKRGALTTKINALNEQIVPLVAERDLLTTQRDGIDRALKAIDVSTDAIAGDIDLGDPAPE